MFVPRGNGRDSRWLHEQTVTSLLLPEATRHHSWMFPIRSHGLRRMRTLYRINSVDVKHATE